MYVYIYAQLLYSHLLSTTFTNDYMVGQAQTSQKIIFDGTRALPTNSLGWLASIILQLQDDSSCAYTPASFLLSSSSS